MCGKDIQGMHLLIGAAIVGATYYRADWVLYLLGGAALLLHGFYLISGTDSKSGVNPQQKTLTARRARCNSCAASRLIFS